MTIESRSGMRAGAGVLLVFALIPAGCRQDGIATTTPVVRADLTATAWTLPASAGASLPDLGMAPDGGILLSWVEQEGSESALRFSRYTDGRWSAPAVIARDEWLGSSVDTPHLRMTRDGALWAQWLRRSKAEGHARDMVLSRSADGGTSWAAPVRVNLDGTPTEHGFVSMWPAAHDRLGMAWLDGRAREAPAGGAHAHGAAHSDDGKGATMLRAAEFDPSLRRRNETAVDTTTCDCCQTDVAMTDRGPLVVYRDRTEDETRDIVATRLQNARWSAPLPVHVDGWNMPGCPINGPAVAADDANVAIAWYTGAGDAPSARTAFSTNAGDAFLPPLELGRGASMLGRVDVALDGRAAWVTWLTEEAEGQSLWLARVDRSSQQVQTLRLARLTGRGRATGFPKIVAEKGRVHVVWSDVADGAIRLKGASISG